MTGNHTGWRSLRGDVAARAFTRLLPVALHLIPCAACAPDDVSQSEQTDSVQPASSIDARRSLAVTDHPVLVNFSLERVLRQIIDTSGHAGIAPADLFQQWWDTQNRIGGRVGGELCDDAAVPPQVSLLNGYPYTCRAGQAEGSQARCDPFADPNSPCAYIPIGLFMRFDLAPAGGSYCGEYRVVFAKSSGKTLGTDRNLLIFEAALRNPHYNQGLRGCQKFVRAWSDLSAEADIERRRATLEQLYFDGYKEFDPIIQYSNFGDNGYHAGQVRTNQFVQPSTPRIWSLREFKILRSCMGSACAPQFVAVTDKVNPFGPLFSASWPYPQAPSFQAELLTHVPGLIVNDINAIGMNVTDTFNSAQSQANGTTETDYRANFGTDPSTFRTSLQAAISELGSSLTPDDVVSRAQAMSCAGCHRLSSGVAIGGGLTWPASLGFTHVSERDLEVVNGVARFQISPALEDFFLPHRAQLVENFLNDVPRPEKPPADPIGGRWTH